MKKLTLSQALLIGIVLISAILALLRLNSFQVGSYFDDAHYIILSKSLVTGQGYHLINFPDKPVEWAFPPGLPLMLASLSFLMSSNYTLFQLFSLTCWLLSVVLVYRLFRRVLPTPYLEIVVALYAFNASAIGLAGMVMSETPYMLFSVLALLIFDKWQMRVEPVERVEKGRTGLSAASVALLFIAILVAAWSQLIRSIGLMLIIAFLAELLLARRFKWLGLAVIFAAVGYEIQAFINGQLGVGVVSSFYATLLSYSPTEKLRQIFSNFAGYVFAPNALFSNLIIPILGSGPINFLSSHGLGAVSFVLALIVPAFIVIGFIITFRQLRAVGLYVLFYMGAVMIFWVDNRANNTDMRYLVAILPFLCLYFVQGVRVALQWLFRSMPKRASLGMGILAALIVLLSMGRNLQDWRNPIRNRIPDVSAGSTWIQTNTPSDAILMTSAAVPTYLYMQRQTVNYPAPNSDVWSDIQKWDVDYVVVSSNIGRDATMQVDQLKAILDHAPAKSKLVYKDAHSGVSIYQISKATASATQ